MTTAPSTARPGARRRVAVLAAALLLVAGVLGATGPADAQAVWDPALTVSKTTGIAREGETVTVTGSGFDPAANTGARPPLMGQPSGVYVVFGKFIDPWKPSLGSAVAPSSNRKVIDQRWAAPASAAGILGGTGQYVELKPDGTFTAELALSMDEATSGTYGIYTFAGSGAVNASQELFVPITFAPEPTTTTSTSTTSTSTSTTSTTAPPSTTTTTVPPSTTSTTEPPASTSTTVTPDTTPDDTTPAPTGPLSVVGGHLDWGVKQSFRSYITGGIAHGSVTPSGGATTNSNGTFRFPARGGEVSADGRDVAAGFGGSVRFTGHGGQLDLALSDLRVDVDGSTGVLVADVESTPLGAGAMTGAAAATPQAAQVYDDVVLATLDVSGTSPTRAETRVTWANVAASLTQAGVPAFSDFYQAGADLDPLTVVLELDAAPSVPEGAPRSGGGAGAVTPRGALPYTGSDTDELLLVAFTLAAAGAGLSVLAARRRAVAADRPTREG
jgi:hypothetical protein